MKLKNTLIIGLATLTLISCNDFLDVDSPSSYNEEDVYKRQGEAFGKNYELPNMSAYCETCAAIGNVYVNYRLFLLHGEAKYRCV